MNASEIPAKNFTPDAAVTTRLHLDMKLYTRDEIVEINDLAQRTDGGDSPDHERKY